MQWSSDPRHKGPPTHMHTLQSDTRVKLYARTHTQSRKNIRKKIKCDSTGQSSVINTTGQSSVFF